MTKLKIAVATALLSIFVVGCEKPRTPAETLVGDDRSFQFFDCKGMFSVLNSSIKPEDVALSLYVSTTVDGGKRHHRLGLWSISSNVFNAFEAYDVRSIDKTSIEFGDGEEKPDATFVRGVILKGTGYAEIRYGYATSKDKFRWWGKCAAVDQPVLLDLNG